MKKLFLIGITSMTISCASNDFIIDPKSSANYDNYHADKLECEDIAKQEDYVDNVAKSSLFKGLATGIGSGALTALGIGAGAGLDIQTSVLLGLGAGGLGGAGLGVWETYDARKDILKKCLEGRGYTILK